MRSRARPALHESTMRAFVLLVLLACVLSKALSREVISPAGGTPTADDFSEISLSKWAQSCIDHLVCYERMSFGGSSLRSIDTNLQLHQEYNTHLPFTAFERELDQFAQMSQNRMKEEGVWNGDTLRFPLSGESPQNRVFQPFVERVDVAPGTRVVLFGDLHGSVHSLLRDLVFLKQQGYLLDDWKIHPRWKGKFQIVFLGDYVDRGLYGVEVIFTLLKLRLANPTGVHMTRGNHEDIYLNSNGGFLHELVAKYPDIHRKKHHDVAFMYEYLPVAIYLSLPSGGDAEGEYIQCCHGGLELGYDAAPFLKSGRPFERITALKRKTIYDALPDKVKQTVESAEDIYDTGSSWPSRVPSDESLGFMWSDFYVDYDPHKGLGYQRGRGFIYGPAVTKHITNSARISAVFRAHQHNNSRRTGPMLDNLVQAHGMVQSWGGRPQVYTFLSASEVPVFHMYFDSLGMLDVHGGDTGKDVNTIGRCYRPVGTSVLQGDFLQCEQFVKEPLSFQCSCHILNTDNEC